MKKKLLLLVTITVCFLLSLTIFTACGENNIPLNGDNQNGSHQQTETNSGGSNDEQGGGTNDESHQQTETNTDNESPDLLNFSGVTFENVTVDYDGQQHTLEVNGAPDDTNISYQGTRSATDAGTYNVTATLTKTGYNKKSLAATLTINKINFPVDGIEFNDLKVDYDGNEHINDLKLIGTLPENTDVSYSIIKNGTKVTSAINAGDYEVTVKLTNKNYIDKSLAATLTIKIVKKDMAVYAMPNGTVYFSNGLDNNHLYSISSNGEINKIKSDVVTRFVKSSDTTLDYVSTATFINSVKTLTQEDENDSVNTIFTFGKFDYIARNNNTFYYSTNLLTKEQSGIYSVDLSSSDKEPESVKLFEGKTKNLAYYDGYLYFANGNDGNTLYKLDISTKTQTKVADVKIHEFVFDKSNLYMTVNGTLNDYIGKLDLTQPNAEIKKISDRAGEYLTVCNGYVYFNNSDMFTNFKPSERGVWKVSVNGADETHVLKLSNGINALTYDSNNERFVYIDATDLHLYAYSIKNNSTIDLLNNFVAPEYKKYNTGGKSVINGNKLYYLNMFADKTLYSYDMANGFNQQLTSDKVIDFYIDGNYLYFNQVTNLTNNDLYRINLTLGGTAEKVSSSDCRNMVVMEDYIYYVHHNFAGAAGGIGRVKKDGSGEPIKFSEINGASNLRIFDDKLYYLNGGKIYYFNLNNIADDSVELEGTILHSDVKNVDQFEIENGNIYYIYSGTITKEIRRATILNPTEYVALVSEKTAPIEFVIAGDDIYYYSWAKTAPADAGLYKVSKNATETDGKTKELLLKSYLPQVTVNDKTNTDKNFFSTSISVKDGKVYFLNSFYLAGTSIGGDDHIYSFDLVNNTLTRLD